MIAFDITSKVKTKQLRPEIKIQAYVFADACVKVKKHL